jgi:ATP-dependent Clp protease ATP-binding subunit ClpC
MDLTPRLRKVLVQAEEEAGRLGHSYVGTEHVLLALLADAAGLRARR